MKRLNWPVLWKNLKSNWYFPISATAFFCISITYKVEHRLAFVLAFLTSIIVAAAMPAISGQLKKSAPAFHALSALTAAGVCLCNYSIFYKGWTEVLKDHPLREKLPAGIDFPAVLGILGAVAALFFVYFCLLLFWQQMRRIITETGVFKGLQPRELVFYGLLIAASLALTALTFARTDAFYATSHLYDVIYTSDSPSLVKGNVYLRLMHAENDLRQPLFALFAMPFTGIPYLLGRLLGAGSALQAALVNAGQICMLFSANLILTRMLHLNPIKRCCFMLLSFCMYSNLLFTLMMEQYIVAYFWLILCMYLVSERKYDHSMALWGAGGSLLTSLALAPLMSDHHPLKKFRAWFMDMVRHALSFLALMIVFCRGDILYTLMSRMRFLTKFAGQKIPLQEKIWQYTEFIRSCFAAPAAGLNTELEGYPSWQLDPASGICIAGVVILALALVSVWVNRKKKSSLLAGCWVAYSVAMLLVLGWGTVENGLILYALYFGWAFLVLLFQLAERIEERLKVSFLVPLLTLVCAAVLAIINIPAIAEMIRFAIAHYPL